MAKDFSQYDDNPVMVALKKAEEEAAAKETDSETVQKSTVQSAPVQTEQAPIEPKKILMNISIRETTKKDWKMFFLEHDLSMTQGIETAVEYLKSEVAKGNIKLSKGGITK